MFIRENMLVKATRHDGVTYTGRVNRIVIQSCDDRGGCPHALMIISQDKRNIESEGDFGCICEWVDQLRSIEVLER